MAVTLNGTNGLTFNDGSSQATAAKVGMVNRIINGAMVIDQRNAGASVTPSANTYTLDRWFMSFGGSATSKMSFQQSSTAPTGFINSIIATVVSTYSVTSSDSININQRIEGLNVSDLAWGTASAATVTLSFWVRSSLTGTFGGSLKNSAADRSYPFTYTISSANTWEQKSITIAGDTTGTWLTTSGIGIILNFSLANGGTTAGTAGAWASANYNSATGATSVVGTNGATFYITGVQLEKGSTATSFDYRPYGTELALCQRYFEKSFEQGTAPANGPNTTSLFTNNNMMTGWSINNSIGGMMVKWSVTKRASPTVTPYGNSNGHWSAAGSFGVNATAYNPFDASMVVNQQQAVGQQLVYGHWTASAEL